MLLKIYIFIIECLILYNELTFESVKAMIGRHIQKVKPHEYPYIVSIMRNNPKSSDIGLSHVCTGILVSLRDVLTIEYCFEEEKGVHIVAETTDLNFGTDYYIFWWYTYNHWSKHNNITQEYEVNDLAISRLIAPVSYEIYPAIITPMNSIDYYGVNVKVAGWGMGISGTKSTTIDVMKVVVQSNTTCRKMLEETIKRKVIFNSRLFCTAEKPYGLIQDGDIGGPVIYKGIIIGINRSVSPITEKCDYEKKINLHYSIEFYTKFIDIVTNYN